jgi:hypothetical protein
MAPWYKFVLYYLWIAPHVLLVAVPVLMLAGRLHKKFPVFFLYCWYETLQFLLLFFHRGALLTPAQTGSYWYVFTATLAGSTALRFGIIQEIVTNVLGDYARLRTLATVSMRWLTALLILAAILTAFYSSGTTSDTLMAGLALLNRGVAIIQAGLLLFLLLFARMFGLSWRGFAFGVALGFGVLASTDLVVSALRLTHLPVQVRHLLNLVPTGSYHVSVVVWLGYLLAAEKPAGAAVYSVPEMDQWSGELGRSPR